jgi:hypothetical protein
MAIFRTSRGRSVRHCHVRPHPLNGCEARQLTRAERQHLREQLAALHPNVVEVRAPSRRYNCLGYAYARAHGWFEHVGLFIHDDFLEVPIANPRRGDVLVYEDENQEIVHSGFVQEVTGSQIKKVRSKWGGAAVVIHDPLDVDESYGAPVRLLRRRRRSHSS